LSVLNPAFNLVVGKNNAGKSALLKHCPCDLLRIRNGSRVPGNYKKPVYLVPEGKGWKTYGK